MNHKSLLMFLWACLVAFQLTRAQSFCLDVGDGVAGGFRDEIMDMIPSGNNMVFLGTNDDFGNDMKTLVGKVSQSGSLLWMRAFNMIDPAVYWRDEYPTSIVEASNGDLVFASTGHYPDGVNTYFYSSIARCNGSNGNLIQSKYFHGLTINKLFTLPNGNIVAFGNDIVATTEGVALLLDANLSVINSIYLGFSVQIYDVVKAGTGYVGVGFYRSSPGQMVVFSLNSNLSVNWARRYGTGYGSTFATSITRMPDGTIAAVGYDGYCSIVDDRRIIILRYSDSGTLLNVKKIGGSDCVRAFDVTSTPNGNMILVGEFLGSNMYMAIDRNGSLIGAKGLGEGYRFNTVAINGSNAIFAGGDRHKPSANFDASIVRITADGENCCAVINRVFTVEDVQDVDIVMPILPQTPRPTTPIVHGSAVDYGVATLICSQPSAKSSFATGAFASMPATPTLSPNPAHDQLQLDLPGDGPSELQLLDLQGRLLREASLPAGQHSLPVSDLESGVYLLRIQGPGGLSTHKLSIQH